VGAFRSDDIDEVQAFYAQRYGMRASVDLAAGLVGGVFTVRWLQFGPVGAENSSGPMTWPFDFEPDRVARVV
jgi:hypothetical protein